MPSAATNLVQFPAAAPSGGSPWDYRMGAPNRRYGLPDGDPGIAKTIGFMRGLARGSEGANHPDVRQHAIEITRGIDQRDKQAQIAAVLDWVKQNIDFRGEYQELLQSPVVTLQLRAGDCDDHSMLLASLLHTLGFNARFSTVAADAGDPDQFTHVFCEVLDPGSGEWTALDSTVTGSYPGWRPAKVYREKSWRPMGIPSQQALMSGLNGMGDASFLSPYGSDPSLATDITALASPITQALGYKIAGTTPIVGDFNFGNLFSSTSGSPTIGGIPWWGVAIFVGIIVWAVKK